MIRRGFKRGTIGPSLRGRFYSYGSAHGEIVATWPPRRPGKGTPDQEFSKKMFADCCVAMKVMQPDFIRYAYEDSAGKPMLPRDALMAALYGRGPVIHKADGTVLRPMATRLDMSMLMDNIAWEEWSMLFRDQDTWQGLSAPESTGFLAFDPAQGYVWVDAVNVSGGQVWQLHGSMGTTNINQNAKGNQYIPFEDITLSEISIGGAWNNEAGIFAFIWEIATSTDTLLTKIWEEELYLQAGSSNRIWHMPVGDIILQAGHRYWIGVRTSTGVATANTIIRTAAPAFGGLPIFPDPARYQLSQVNPAPGHVLTFGSASSVFAIGLKGK